MDMEQLMATMEQSGAVRLRNHQITRLERLILTDGGAHINRSWVGKCPSEMLRQIEISRCHAHLINQIHEALQRADGARTQLAGFDQPPARCSASWI